VFCEIIKREAYEASSFSFACFKVAVNLKPMQKWGEVFLFAIILLNALTFCPLS
jgi:hypothetical protein